MTQVTDEMVEAFWAARNKAARDGLSDDEIDKAGIAAALAAMWRPIEEHDKAIYHGEFLVAEHIGTIPIIFIGFYNGEQWKEADGSKLNPTHFQPLPSPPKETRT